MVLLSHRTLLYPTWVSTLGRTTPCSVSAHLQSDSISIETWLSDTLTDIGLRRNRDLPDSATQNHTLHLYDTSQSRPTPRYAQPASRSPVRTQRIPALSVGADDNDTEDEDDDDDDFMWGGMRGNRGSNNSEDTSMKVIKKVRGVMGSWTVTDCDADRKAEK